MVQVREGKSRSLTEYGFVYTEVMRNDISPEQISLAAPLQAFSCTPEAFYQQLPPLQLRIPFISAMMQAVFSPELAISLARLGGIAASNASQQIAEQAEKHRKIAAGVFPSIGGINTMDYRERVPALVRAGASMLWIDSSNGMTGYQQETALWIKERYQIPIAGGCVHSREGFRFLAEECKVDVVKVGIGGGSICITNEVKGTGRGLATALIEVAAARDAHFRRTGTYIPLVVDGGLFYGKDIAMALALGGDAVMMGRYFARFPESPTEPVLQGGKRKKPYWGEGSSRAQQWREQRYQAKYEQGVEGFVECADSLENAVGQTVAVIKDQMKECAATTIQAFQEKAVVEEQSLATVMMGRPHGIELDGYYATEWNIRKS